MLILAGISIISLKNNGIINKTTIAKNEYKNAQVEEEQYLKNLENKIGEETSGKKEAGTKERMFILSKEENEKYEEYTAIEWEGSQNGGNNSYWTRTYAGKNKWVYCRTHTGKMSYLDVTWTKWNGCKPVYVSDKY